MKGLVRLVWTMSLRRFHLAVGYGCFRYDSALRILHARFQNIYIHNPRQGTVYLKIKREIYELCNDITLFKPRSYTRKVAPVMARLAPSEPRRRNLLFSLLSKTDLFMRWIFRSPKRFQAKTTSRKPQECAK